MAKIERINHWMLGDAVVSPYVEVVNTRFQAWVPYERGKYSMQALHYSIMHSKAMAEDVDLELEQAYSCRPAHDRSLLMTYLWAERASRMSAINPDGSPYPPIAIEEAESLDYDALDLRIDTATLRHTTAQFYSYYTSTLLKWVDEPPLILLPLESTHLYPNDMSKQDQSLMHEITQWLPE